MSTELRPLGVTCNLSCSYCYQEPQRSSGNYLQRYDLERMKAAVERSGGPFVLFGGEPLLVPIEDLEALWRFGLEKYGQNAIQTHAGINKPGLMKHLMKKYDGHVYFHYNYWCNTDNKRNRRLCQAIKEKYLLKEIMRADEQHYTYVLYRIEGLR